MDIRLMLGGDLQIFTSMTAVTRIVWLPRAPISATSDCHLLTLNLNTTITKHWISIFPNEWHFFYGSAKLKLIGPWEIWMKFQTCNFQIDFSNWRLRHLLWNCPNMIVIGLHWWSVNIGSGNSLVSSGNKPLPEPMLPHISVAIWRH